MTIRAWTDQWRAIPLLLLVVTTSACVSNDTRDASLSPAEQQMRAESKFFTKSNVQACLATGLALGVVMALLSSGGNRGRNAAVGFAAGCGIGVGVNSYVQNKRTQYRNNEQRMNAFIQDLRKDNDQLSQLIHTSGQVMQEDRRRIAQIDSAYENKTISLGEAKKRMARVRDNRDHLKTTLTALKKKESEWLEVRQIEQRGGVNTARLDAEIVTLEQQVSALEGEIELMDQQIAASPVPA